MRARRTRKRPFFAPLESEAPLALVVVPSLRTFTSPRALRYDQLGSAWRVARRFAADSDRDSDALELEHVTRRGFYAQFLCTQESGTPRAAVLAEYLSNRICLGRLAPPGPRR